MNRSVIKAMLAEYKISLNEKEIERIYNFFKRQVGYTFLSEIFAFQEIAFFVFYDFDHSQISILQISQNIAFEKEVASMAVKRFFKIDKKIKPLILFWKLNKEKTLITPNQYYKFFDGLKINKQLKNSHNKDFISLCKK